MLLNADQIDLLKGDLDYIIPRTKCNTIQLNRGHIFNAIEKDPDVLLDLIHGLAPTDSRWLSLPPDVLAALVARRFRGLSGAVHCTATATLAV